MTILIHRKIKRKTISSDYLTGSVFSFSNLIPFEYFYTAIALYISYQIFIRKYILRESHKEDRPSFTSFIACLNWTIEQIINDCLNSEIRPFS